MQFGRIFSWFGFLLNGSLHDSGCSFDDRFRNGLRLSSRSWILLLIVLAFLFALLGRVFNLLLDFLNNRYWLWFGSCLFDLLGSSLLNYWIILGLHLHSWLFGRSSNRNDCLTFTENGTLNLIGSSSTDQLDLTSRLSISKSTHDHVIVSSMNETKLLSLVDNTIGLSVCECSLLTFDLSATLLLILTNFEHVILESALIEVTVGEVESAL